MAEKGHRAIVGNIVDGRHGPYAVATAEGIKGSVTFSLDPSVWKGKKKLELGTEVMLYELTKKRAGWRAGRVRFYEPSDE